MKRLLLVLLVLFLCSFTFSGPVIQEFPYKKAGLTERQAAAHLLNRFSYGATPGQIDAVVKMGLENWFAVQLKGELKNDLLDEQLKHYDALTLSNEEVVKLFPRPGQVIRLGIAKGYLPKDSLRSGGKPEYRQQLQSILEKEGLRPQQELFRQFFNQKILRAAYTPNQLREVLTDFWFNHFNVSLTNNNCAEFVPAYERDVIRPNVFGKFGTLLTATAKSPAMLYYLDNFSSAGPASLTPQQEKQRSRLLQKAVSGSSADSMMNNPALKRLQQARNNRGLNENYAREVMELHTLGVDGGYTQLDVTQAAKVLTGWTVYPLGNPGSGPVAAVVQRLGNRAPEELAKQGSVREGDFLFAANRHDNSDKIVLGKRFASDGYAEGQALLDMLAHHASTAKFISRKLAVRFVSDVPPQSLVDKMAKTFAEKDGDISAVLITLVSSPEFWSKEALREKTKSPFELAISAIRGLNAKVSQPYQIYSWITKMGQRMYYYQAPTGFPDRGQYWINTGSLLNRMNFGLALASQRIPGVTFSLAALNDNHEPESAEAALRTYSRIFLPERPLEETIQRLTPLLNDPELDKKISAAADKTQPAGMQPVSDPATMPTDPLTGKNPEKIAGRKNAPEVHYAKGNTTMLAQVVGVILGSPEFQRK